MTNSNNKTTKITTKNVAKYGESTDLVEEQSIFSPNLN